MNKETLTEKFLDLVEGRETPESWRSWWDEYESELETLLNCGEFLKLKPCRHGSRCLPAKRELLPFWKRAAQHLRSGNSTKSGIWPS